MWRTALPLLVGVLGVGVVATRKRKAKPVGGTSRVDPIAPKTFTGRERFTPLRTTARRKLFRRVIKLPPPRLMSTRLGVRYALQNPLVDLFGKPTANEYPAPYRYVDAWEIGNIVLRAASETAPAFEDEYKRLRRRMASIDRAPIPNWRKTYAVIMTVVIPSFGSPLWWHWYRPRSNTKQERFDAIISWASLFLTMPNTATSATTISVGRGMSSLLPGFGAYIASNTRVRRGDLNYREMRRCLYDVFSYLRHWGWHHKHLGWSETGEDLMLHAGARMADLNAVYPLSDPQKFIIEGNLKAVNEIVWFANANVQASISVDFDEAAAIASIVVNVVAAVVSAVVPMVGGAIGAAIQQSANALSALATMVAEGKINNAQLQAMAGAGVALMLDQAGIRLGYDDAVRELTAKVPI